MQQPTLAIIGGTGVYDMRALENVEELAVSTPFGPPSDVIRMGTLAGSRVAFLARHGRGHRLLPSEVPYRANIWALKSLGVERIVAVSACGSMKDTYAPGDIVVPDQLFDRTRGRPGTFFGEGLVAHIAFAEPFCPGLSRMLCQVCQDAGARVHAGGTYLIIEGPRFSTRGESLIFRRWGVDIIGMTAVPEAQLAREAEMCYALMAHVTDYDSWHESEAAVSVEMVVKTLHQNAELAQKAIAILAGRLRDEPAARACECPNVLGQALLTAPDSVPAATKERLRPIIGKYMPL